MTLQSHLLHAALEKSAGISFVRSGNIEERVTYSEIYAKGLKILGGLNQIGVRRGDELVIQVQDNKDLLLLFWACILGGIIPVPLSPGVQLQQKTKLYQIWKYLSNPYFAGDDLVEMNAGIDPSENDIAANIRRRTLDLRAIFIFPEPGVVVPVSESDIAYIQFSSGSTGDPKGVILTHGNLDANISDIRESLEIRKSDKLLSWMPMTHDMGMIGFHLTGVANSIDAVSIDTQLFIRRPLLWMEKTNTHRASVLYSPNFGLQYFLSSLQQRNDISWDLTCIRIIVNGAETISARLCAEFSQTLQRYGLSETAIVTAYGLAEACVEVSAMPVNTPIRSHCVNREFLNVGDPVRPEKPGSPTAINLVDVGWPVSSCSVRICDGADAPLSGCIIGHIQVAGKNISSGYYNNTAATRSAFTEDNWLRTGDVGFVVDGRLVITGRFKNIVIVNGKNFYPHDIERAIVEAGISELGKVAACGIQRPGDEKGEELIIFFIHKGRLEELMVRSRKMAAVVYNSVGVRVDKIVPIRKMPKTTSGKIQYFQLAEAYQNGELEAIPIHYEEQEVEDILSILRSLLGVESITEDTNLIASGLNSLTAVQLTSRLRKNKAPEVSIEDIFNASTVGDLMQLLRIGSFKERPMPAPSTALPGVAGMSLAQQRIWMEMQLYPFSVAYNIPLIYRLEGTPDILSLEKAIREIIKKYEILRTSYHLVEGHPVQKIHPFDEQLFSLSYANVSEEADAERELWGIYEGDINAVFELERPCQLRGRVVRTGKNSYSCVLVFHHILTDGWSLAILMNEISGFYRAALNGLTVATTEGLIQYRDYVCWQRQIMDTAAYLESKAYWAKEMEHSPAPITLSGKAPLSNANRGTAAGHYHKAFLPREFSMLNCLAAEYGATPFCILMTLLYILLYRYSGKKDIVIGFDTSARVSDEMEKIAGYLINTLCLRYSVHEEESIADVIRQIKKKILKAIAHQQYPFEELLVMKKPEHNVLQNPFFDILVLYQNFHQHGSSLQIEGCITTPEHVPVKEALAGLVLEFNVREGSLHLDVQYISAQYSHSEIGQLGEHMSNLLEEIATKKHSEKIILLDFLTEREKAMPLGTPSPMDRQDPAPQPIHRIFQQRSASNPGDIAVVAGDKELSYGELDVITDRLSTAIRKRLRIDKDDRIGFLTRRNEDIVIAILAILKSGAAYVPIDPEWPAERRNRVMVDSGIKCLLTDDMYYAGLDQADVPDVLNMSTLEEGSGIVSAAAHATMTDLAYVVYTSGSAGKPKGIMIEHHTLSHYVRQFIDYFRITEKDVFVQQASVAFDTLVEEIFPALCTGGKIVIAKHGGKDTEALLEDIDKHKATILTTTPLVLKELNERSDARTCSLRTIISGGDVLSPACVDRLIHAAAVYNTYGPSETTVCASYKKIEDVSQAALIGRPIDGYRIYILDENMQLLPWGKAGQLYIAGGCARGYIGEQELTRQKFTENPFEANSLLYKTGDLGRWTEDGDLEFIGRNDNQVKVRGHRVEMEEVEKVIMGYTGISMAVVHQEQQDGYLTAFLLRSDHVLKTKLHSYLVEKLPHYMIPYNYIMVDEIPRTSSGKIDKKVLREALPGDATVVLPTKAIAPQSKLEKLLAGMWEDILRHQHIGVTDNFFELGGHSLSATQLLNRIYMATGVEIQLIDIFTYPTIIEQSKLIAKQEEKKYLKIDII